VLTDWASAADENAAVSKLQISAEQRQYPRVINWGTPLWPFGVQANSPVGWKSLALKRGIAHINWLPIDRSADSRCKHNLPAAFLCELCPLASLRDKK
jgi:hypothetical protein